MLEPGVLAVILVLGLASYAMRVGGFLAAGAMPRDGLFARLLRIAPGNLFVAFTASGILQGGWGSLAGCAAVAAVMAATRKEWLALAVGFAAVALATALPN